VRWVSTVSISVLYLPSLSLSNIKSRKNANGLGDPAKKAAAGGDEQEMSGERRKISIRVKPWESRSPARYLRSLMEMHLAVNFAD
jgi:hypothetical protein